jgi:hypothetical protein
MIPKAENGEYKNGADLYNSFKPFMDLVIDRDDRYTVVESDDYYYFVHNDDDYNEFYNEHLNLNFKTSIRKGKFESKERLIKVAESLCLEML